MTMVYECPVERLGKLGYLIVRRNVDRFFAREISASRLARELRKLGFSDVEIERFADLVAATS